MVIIGKPDLERMLTKAHNPWKNLNIGDGPSPTYGKVYVKPKAREDWCYWTKSPGGHDCYLMRPGTVNGSLQHDGLM